MKSMHIKRDLYNSKETHGRNRYISKEPYMCWMRINSCHKIPAKRDVYESKKTHRRN